MRLPFILTAMALLASPALAQDAAGDWIGKVQTPGGDLTITVHMQTAADGRLEGHAGSPDQTLQPLPLSEISAAGGRLTFAVPVVGAQYSGAWDAAAKGWVGTFTQRGYGMPLTLVPGKPGPRPVVTGLDGDWAGVLSAPQGELRLIVRVRTDAGGTLAMFASPDQGPQEMVATLARDGEAVSVTLKGIGGFEGRLAPDGATMVGEWKQGGASLPLTLKKGG